MTQPFEVANNLGPGFLEKVYERALLLELGLRSLQSVSQVPITVYYKDVIVGDYCPDILVEDTVIVELKCVESLGREHIVQCLNYLKATGLEWKRLILGPS